MHNYNSYKCIKADWSNDHVFKQKGQICEAVELLFE